MKNVSHEPNPVVVGGVGGSGTRLVAEILKEVGIDIGGDLNVSADNLWFTLLLKRPQGTSPPSRLDDDSVKMALGILEKGFTGKSSLTIKEKLFTYKRALRLILTGHDLLGNGRGRWPLFMAKRIIQAPQQHRGAGRWGWKEPNSHLYLKQLAEVFPELRYVHVVRNGLDMAYSANQMQFMLWGETYGVERPRTIAEVPRKSLEYWIRSNNKVMDFAKTMGENQFLSLDFDLLCSSPETEIKKLTDFIGIEVDESRLSQLATMAKTPRRTGRYKAFALNEFSDEQVEQVQRLGIEVPDRKTLAQELAALESGTSFTEKDCVIVLGMHRSGTSMMTGVLHTLGLDLGNIFLQKGRSNRKGHFEHLDLYFVNESILTKLGSSWKDTEPLPSGWHEDPQLLPYIEIIKNILVMDFGGSLLFALKEPRMCLLLPLYLKAFDSLGLTPKFIVMQRSHEEVAESLFKRSGLPLEKGMALCRKYQSSIEESIAGRDQVTIQFKELIQQPIQQLETIQQELDLGFETLSAKKDQVLSFIDPSLQHHDESATTAATRKNRVRRMVQTVIPPQSFAHKTLRKVKRSIFKPQDGPWNNFGGG